MGTDKYMGIPQSRILSYSMLFVTFNNMELEKSLKILLTKSTKEYMLLVLAKTTIRVDLKLNREDFVGSPKMYWFLYTVA